MPFFTGIHSTLQNFYAFFFSILDKKRGEDLLILDRERQIGKAWGGGRKKM